MDWTKEQLSDVERARQDDPEVQRHHGALTDDQQAEYARLIEQELTGKAQVVRDAQPLRDALKESGFSGELRRAIVASGRSPVELQRETGCDALAINHFLRGEQTLPTDVVDKLMRTLGLAVRLETTKSRCEE